MLECPECGVEIEIRVVTKKKPVCKPVMREDIKFSGKPRNVFDWPEFKGNPAEARKYINDHGTYL